MAQDEISKKVELNWLSAFYGGLLTDKQRQVLTLHCEEDLSLTEIAQEVGISRQGVHELLTRAARKMFEMEEKLHVAARFQRVENGLEKCRAMMREGRYDDAERVIDALIRFVGDAVNHSGNLRRNRNRYHRLLRQKGVRVVIVH